MAAKNTVMLPYFLNYQNFQITQRTRKLKHIKMCLCTKFEENWPINKKNCGALKNFKSEKNCKKYSFSSLLLKPSTFLNNTKSK